MKSKSLIIIITTVIFLLIIIFFLIRPVVSSVWTSWKALSQTKNELATLEEKKQIIDQLKNSKNLEKVAEIAKKYIPENSESGDLVIELTAMAQANNLKVEQTTLEKPQSSTKPSDETATPTPNNSPTAGQSANGSQTVDFSMRISGSFTDFINFLKTLETSSRLISLENLTMQSKIVDKTTVFSVQITGSAYYKSRLSLENTLENIKISQDTLDKFLNLKTYGQPINLPTESDFGRTNPFEQY